MNNAKKQRKTVEWERLETSSRKRAIKGITHVRMGTIKDRKEKDLTEAEEIKKRWQENTEELYKKGLNDPDNHKDMVILLEPNIWTVKSSGPQKYY